MEKGTLFKVARSGFLYNCALSMTRFPKTKKREVKIMDNEGYDEIINWEFTEDGVDGFTETIQHFKRLVPDDMITYL